MNTDSQSTRLRRRKAIFWIFICIFIPLAALLVAYATGYRFDTATRSIIELSALSIDTIPDDAAVYINGSLKESRTPYIQTILPGEYTVRVEKEGYFPWEKQLLLEAKKSIIFPRLTLFAVADATLVDSIPHDDNDAEWKPISDELREAYQKATASTATDIQLVEGPELLLVDHQQDRSYIVHDRSDFDTATKINGAITHAQWLNTQLLLSTSTELSLYNRENNSVILLTRQAERIVDVAWHPNGDAVFFSDARGVHAMELDARGARQVWTLSTLSSSTRLVTNARASTLWFESNGKPYSLLLTRP